MRTVFKRMVTLIPILIIGFLFITASLDSAASVDGPFMLKYGLTIIVVVVVAVFGIAAVGSAGRGKQ